MQNNYYDLYLKSVADLAKTIVIKFDDVVDSINNWMMIEYPDQFDATDPTSWRYYKNIAGEYHHSNEPMYITSLDTQERILFSKAALAIHRSTSREYQYGTRYYKELVSQYPDQEMLILGILYPVTDIAAAIKAPNGTILGWPAYLVEENEYSLIPRLQDWVYGFVSRWINKQYKTLKYSDDMYMITTMGVMYMNLIPVIFALRLEARKTNEAHSFHVWQYLASYGALDVYKDQLTLKQALWLYRNLLYIRKHTGHTSTFSWLTEHIMTERSIPLAEYTMRHELENQPANLYPEVRFKRTPLNPPIMGDPNDNVSLDQMLRKEDQIATENVRVREEDGTKIQEKFENSASNVVQTKALESSMFDYSNSSPYSLEDILLNHWIFLSTHNVYRAFVRVTNPTNGEVIPLPAKDAFMLAFYCYCHALGFDLVEVPKLIATRVQRIPLVTPDEIMKVVDPKLVSRDTAVDALSKQPFIDVLLSTEAFYNLCQEIFEAANYQRGLMAFQEHHVARGMVHNMVSQIYADTVCRFEADGTTFDEWFAARNINIEEFVRDDQGLEVYLAILRQATGVDLTTTNSKKALQRAMVNIMTQLSSYSVQWLRQINDSAIKQLDMPVVRVGDWDGFLKDLLQVPGMAIRVLRHRGKLKPDMYFPIGGCGVLDTNLSGKLFGDLHFEITVQPRVETGMRTVVRHITSCLHMSIDASAAQNDEGIIPVPGLEYYLAQNEADRLFVADVYGNCKVDYDKQSKLPD